MKSIILGGLFLFACLLIGVGLELWDMGQRRRRAGKDWEPDGGFGFEEEYP